MKILCPNCQKTYRIDPAKISSGVSAAICKSCRMPIQLKQAVSDDTPAKTQILQLKCTYCGQTQAIQPKKIPSHVKTIQCVSCGHFIGLQPAHAQNRSEKVAKQPSTEKQADKSPRAPSDPKAIIQITCRNCHKKYKIRRQKIPAHAKAVRCKACGQKIAIELDQQASIPVRGPQPKESKQHKPEKKQPRQPLFRLDLMPEIRPGKIYRPRKKIWVIAAAVCVLVVIAVVLWL